MAVMDRQTFKAGTKVVLTLPTDPGEEAIVLEAIPPRMPPVPGSPVGPASGAVAGADGLPWRYRVQVVRTGKELLVDEDDVRPLQESEYEASP